MMTIGGILHHQYHPNRAFGLDFLFLVGFPQKCIACLAGIFVKRSGFEPLSEGCGCRRSNCRLVVLYCHPGITCWIIRTAERQRYIDTVFEDACEVSLVWFRGVRCLEPSCQSLFLLHCIGQSSTASHTCLPRYLRLAPPSVYPLTLSGLIAQ